MFWEAFLRDENELVVGDYFEAMPELAFDQVPPPPGQLEEWEMEWIKKQRRRMGLL